jgi:Leucine-rich repeat (LRR) protein
MCRFLLPTAALLLSVAAVRADPPTADQIQSWIRDLDSSTFKTRDLAMRGLRQAGADAAAPLAKAARNGSTEVADRALRLLGEMADGSDAKAEAAARRHLHRLADSESNVAGEARTLLNRKRNRLLTQLSFAGATYRDTSDGLVYLDLDDARDLEGALRILKFFPEIEELTISNKLFNDKSAVHLAELPNLRYLNLYRSNIGDEGLKHLTGLKNLRKLPMGETRVTDKGLKIISGMTQLEYVGVRGDNVTDAGVAHLKGLTNLTGLYLGETKVTDKGLAELAPLNKLQLLILNETAISDTGLEHIKGFKDLKQVTLTRTKTTKEGQARLKEALPECEIYDATKSDP